MAKSKTYKLKRTPRTYSPIIAVLGGKHHTEYMPILNANRTDNNKNNTVGKMRVKSTKGIFKRTTY